MAITHQGSLTRLLMKGCDFHTCLLMGDEGGAKKALDETDALVGEAQSLGLTFEDFTNLLPLTPEVQKADRFIGYVHELWGSNAKPTA